MADAARSGTQSFIQVKEAEVDHMRAVRPRSPTS